ncbi:unnamed protein product [Clonostachys solani]|uniref:Survival Motor Neuron Gemin2-binding domain-containing protein n=1 Tax=Clonostachys solani TaxID=160281 RepID=A0A9P0EK08_9HYPO|nr:unnamed protein product [Clonostachys solani]
MAQASSGLTHDEIWDDSALIESWNDALAEYKKYHSIHAKGGTLEDLERAVEAGTDSAPAPEETLKVNDEQQSESKVDESAGTDKSEPKPQVAGLPVPSPHALLGTVKDENMKRLLMSWYYAGYYTGLYEGQQQAKSGS